jgi:hypothetical protein
MNPYDLTSAAAHAHVHELRDAACASRLAARAACARSARGSSTSARLRAALHLGRAATDCG